MNTATYPDAALIAGVLDIDIETVWQIIKGMKYSCYTDLEKAVENALLGSSGRTE